MVEFSRRMLAGRLFWVQKLPRKGFDLGQNAGKGHWLTYESSQQMVIMHLPHGRRRRLSRETNKLHSWSLLIRWRFQGTWFLVDSGIGNYGSASCSWRNLDRFRKMIVKFTLHSSNTGPKPGISFQDPTCPKPAISFRDPTCWPVWGLQLSS